MEVIVVDDGWVRRINITSVVDVVFKFRQEYGFVIWCNIYNIMCEEWASMPLLGYEMLGL